MCGRLDQNDIPRLLASIEWADAVFMRSQADSSYNVSPGSYRPVLHAVDDALFLDDLHWGYRASWAEAAGKIPVTINTRLEKLGSSYWRPLMKRGRAIVPAAGWYEWTGEKGQKQPWHIHRGDRAPLYLAALTPSADPAEPSEHKTGHGFTIITANTEGGLLATHDRRPLVLSAADAALWLDLDLSAEQAAHLLRSVSLPPDAFAWYRVDKAVNNARNQSAEVAAPATGPVDEEDA